MKIVTSILGVIVIFFALAGILTPLYAKKIDENQLIVLKMPPLVPEIDPHLPARRVGVYWSGLRIAHLYTEIKPLEGNKLEMQAVIQSYGIAKMITKYKSTTRTILLREGDSYRPESVTIDFKMRYGTRHIELTYAPDGTLINEKNTPPEKRDKRKAVSAALTKGAFDPLAAALEARSRVMAMIKNGAGKKQFSLPMYDGRRLSRLDFSVQGLDENGRVHLTLTENPVEGWTGNEMKEKKARNPIIHVYLDTKDYLPVYAVGESKVGSSQGKLEAACASLKECM